MMIARMPSIIWANASERAPSSLAAAAVTRDGGLCARVWKGIENSAS
jgi:hypothetical protein